MTSSRLHTVALVLSLLVLPACLEDGPAKIAWNDEPRALDDGWEIGAPEDHGFDREKLREAFRPFFSEDELVPAISLLVIRDGVLVAEGYARDLGDVHRKNAIMSATKSVTSLVAGIAIDRASSIPSARSASSSPRRWRAWTSARPGSRFPTCSPCGRASTSPTTTFRWRWPTR